jgi:hypothetical protein
MKTRSAPSAAAWSGLAKLAPSRKEKSAWKLSRRPGRLRLRRHSWQVVSRQALEAARSSANRCTLAGRTVQKLLIGESTAQSLQLTTGLPGGVVRGKRGYRTGGFHGSVKTVGDGGFKPDSKGGRQVSSERATRRSRTRQPRPGQGRPRRAGRSERTKSRSLTSFGMTTAVGSTSRSDSPRGPGQAGLARGGGQAI